MDKKTIPAGAFKQGCLAVLDEVEAGRMEVTITKRGRPVARLVPIPTPAELEAEALRACAGQGRTLVSEAELLAPSSEDEDWSAISR